MILKQAAGLNLASRTTPRCRAGHSLARSTEHAMIEGPLKPKMPRPPPRRALASIPTNLVVTTPRVGLSMRLGGRPMDRASEARLHDLMIDLVRALARDAARMDVAAGTVMGEDDRPGGT